MQTYTFNCHAIKIQNNDDGQVWFCGADVARAIGYKNPAEAISSKVSRKYRTSLDLGKRGSKPIFISKPGLYELVMRSNLPAAVPFQAWVYEEVLPSIEETGTYTGQMPLAELGTLLTNLPALITKENSAQPKRAFKVRDLVAVDYGGSDQREAIILDFLAHHIYLKFLDSGKTDFAVASQLSRVEVNSDV